MKKVILLAFLLLTACNSKSEDELYLKLNPVGMTFTARYDEPRKLQVFSNGDWEFIRGDESWVHLEPKDGSGDGVVTVWVDDNDGDQGRSTTFQVLVSDKRGRSFVWGFSVNQPRWKQ